jgi:hypothetical protein
MEEDGDTPYFSVHMILPEAMLQAYFLEERKCKSAKKCQHGT